jgi:hypothetical protein
MIESILEESGRIAELEQLDWLQTHVQGKLRGRVNDLRILHRNGGLVLRGTSFSFYGKQLAQEAVMAASDLTILANEIQVM